MKFKLYYENKDSTQGGWEEVGFFKLTYRLLFGSICSIDNSDIYYIRKLERNGKRI